MKCGYKKPWDKFLLNLNSFIIFRINFSLDPLFLNILFHFLKRFQHNPKKRSTYYIISHSWISIIEQTKIHVDWYHDIIEQISDLYELVTYRMSYGLRSEIRIDERWSRRILGDYQVSCVSSLRRRLLRISLEGRIGISLAGNPKTYFCIFFRFELLLWGNKANM